MNKQCSKCEEKENCRELENFQNLRDGFIKGLGDKENKLTDGLSAKNLVLYSCPLGRYLVSRKLKTSQIRRFLDAFRTKNADLRISTLKKRHGKEQVPELKATDEALLLEPRLAYAAGRQPAEVGPLFEVLKPAIERVQDADDFDRLTRFLESVVAYHKYHGGRD